jgi:predicted TIM-barrel fold metal-dependent hydrolase
MQALNICVAEGQWRDKDKTHFRGLAARHPERFAWITSFDLPDYEQTNGAYAERVISELDADFQAGAVACKAWKNIGMELRDRAGRYVMIDDPVFEPIFTHLENQQRSVVMHIGEPLACWQPLQAGTPHYGYYSTHPQWHMHGRTDMPDHAALVAARDRVVERHPKLRVIGAHYGSLEFDVAQVAKRFDQYANFAVDTSARLADAAYQDREKVREFFIRYQDRIIWGSDVVLMHKSGATADQQEQSRKALEAQYELEWSFFAGNDTVTIQGRACRGLALPDSVLHKLFFANVRAWYPLLRLPS